MGAEKIKEILHLRIEQADERFLRILYAMTEAYANEHLQEEEITDEMIMAIPAPPWAKPKTQEELTADIKEGLEQYHRGEYVTLEELEKETKQW